MAQKDFNILIGGEAGQGLQTVGEVFSRSIVRSGYHIFVTQTYESRVRGGHNTFAIRIGAEKVNAPRESIDLLMALNEETVRLHKGALTSGGRIVGAQSFELPDKDVLIKVPFADLSTKRFFNVVALGVSAAILGLDEGLVFQTLQDLFLKDHPQYAENNKKALAAAFRWAKKQSLKIERPSPNGNAPRRLVMNGHEAVAMGAISAGMKFCAFYPMSPSTSIPVTLVQWAKQMGLVVEQAEDEIAAINMAIGASYAGVPSLVPTSGGGFSLMVEAVSLAAISETPVVILLGQRPGPATGLATRTEQGELEFVLYSGHGEFPRAIFAPGTLEECFQLTRKAFALAEKYQGPIFILTDHFLADSYRDVLPFEVGDLPYVKPGVDPAAVKTPYLRYRITQDGISPRLLPGLSEHLVVADSHEHIENGHMTEDLTIRPKMNDKRLRKGKGLAAEVTPPGYQGDKDPDLLLVSWGSSKGAVEEATSLLRSKDNKTAALHFSQVWPMVPKHFLEHLQKAGEVVCVESNATGQLARVIRRETGFVIQKHVLRYDGLVLTPEYILRHLER
jgi:2-oxoglutarate ferredoxin oxidoreductase subunit alpha